MTEGLGVSKGPAWTLALAFVRATSPAFPRPRGLVFRQLRVRRRADLRGRVFRLRLKSSFSCRLRRLRV
jgi:hypothetical protein